MKKQTKKKFEVENGETIDQCLERMKQEGYIPVRRVEEPIFREVTVNEQTEYEPSGRRIIFEGKMA
ncbi:NETI motif-containing protein [Cytobacillus sp. S13-E01]|uniref:NETI motif-containing protein n=1 Tax=Cytobacillus sp. S13-E01 TaxID=3031326 RepID=UPI0023D89E9B|nr:NETI motif-containing protein [Cytobacillus sp. S13-E01]MDF0728788.1 NETI motif-containing protein [Cytobacillus sp. S13-E01]